MTPIGELKSELSGSGIEAASGPDAVAEAARRPAEWVIGAITGAAGLEPALAAIERGATLALANKECLVCAGSLFMRRAKQTGATVLPVDLRAQCAVSGDDSRAARGCHQGHHHGLGRAVPHLVEGRDPQGDARKPR